jgi:hypothetical protein
LWILLVVLYNPFSVAIFLLAVLVNCVLVELLGDCTAEMVTVRD